MGGRGKFETVSPESIGISSKKVLEFIQILDKYKLNTHSIIMARGNKVFAEAYYAPFDEKFKHRMYSVSKSFVAIAIGFAEQDGLLSLDDPFIKYFPEYVNEKTDNLYRETTVRDMLCMRTCMAGRDPGYWGKTDRAKTYFDMDSNKIPGTNYFYDSAAAFLLGCIVEKMTGKLFMDYLKEKVLMDIGFSEDSYCLLAPGDHSHSDSGVMCTSRELLAFASFVMNFGRWNGKRYLNEDFVRAAVAKQVDNDITGSITAHANHGYGYLIWKAPRDGFVFVGKAGQLAVCDPKTDFILIMTAENMDSDEASRMLIYHELYRTIIENLGGAISEDEAGCNELKAYLASREMMSLTDGVKGSIEAEISGKTYVLEPNPMGLESIKVTIKEGEGELEYLNAEGSNRIRFGMGRNVYGRFPEKMRMSLTASVYEDGNYACGASAVWCEEEKLHIMVRVIDTYLGTLSIVLGFKDNRVTLSMTKHAQRILDEMSGHTVGYIVGSFSEKISGKCPI